MSDNGLLINTNIDPNVVDDQTGLTEELKNQLTDNSNNTVSLDLPKFTQELDTSSPTVQTVDVQAPPSRRKLTPEEQAEAVLQNWLTVNPNRFPSGHEKRMMKRQFLRNAKKGKYEHIFNK